MASIVAYTGVRPLMGCIAALALSLVWHNVRADAEILFDLPAQPLKIALEKFDAVTNLSVFFSSELATDKISSAVHGYFNPRQALQKLLEGTGLGIQSVASEAFVLILLPQQKEETSVAAAASRYFDGLVQQGIRKALCARPDLALGSYRLAMMVQLDQQGQVRQARLLDSTGNRQRDAAIVGEVKKVHVGEPPRSPEKPFVILIRPRPEHAPPVCAPAFQVQP